MHRTLAGILSFVVAAGLYPGAAPLAAQQQRAPEVLRNADGEVFDFHPNGAWRVLARRIAAQRRALLERGDIGGLNAAMAAPSTQPAPAAVTGIRRVPAILFRFSDVGTAPNLASSAGDTSRYNQLLFSSTAPTGMGYATPYSIRSFYYQMSNTLLDLQGVVVGWYTLANAEGNYTGGSTCTNPYNGSGNCNGIWSSAATTAMRSGLSEALTQTDATVDFGLYDNDGPDGVSEALGSTDDDGFVDMAIFVHSEQDGACLSPTNNHLWSHRSQMPSGGFTTNDARTGGGFIRVRDYTLQSGVGGSAGCNASFIMSIGTAAHESGHAFGLPDLYDTQQGSEGIGNWGLMGSGNQTSGSSPSRMEAWSLNELGWVTLVPLTLNGNYSFGPAPLSDSTFLVRVQNPNTRKEFFFIENRQAQQADTALIRTMCGRSGGVYGVNCRGGLAIWQADSSKILAGKPSNSMNTGSIHGLSLIQADNRRDLEQAPGAVGQRGRGDAGDLYPGFSTSSVDSLPNSKYSFDTTPKAIKNADSSFIGFEISNITQVAPNGAMSFTLTFGGLTIVRAADTTAKVKVTGGSLPNGIVYNRFAGLLANDTIYSISMDSPQTSTDGRSQFLWQSWSDGMARTHDITGNFAGDSISATISTKYKVQAGTSGTGSVASVPVVDHANGAFVDKNSAMTLTATASGGSVFERWIGDVNVTTNPLVLPMDKPYNVTAVFSGALAVSSGNPPDPLMGKPYTFNLTATGGTGQYSWAQTGGAFPTGMSLGSNGTISGVAEVAGPYSVNVRVTSGAQTSDAALSFTVTEPTLTLDNVLGGLLFTGGTLTTDDRTYLDLIGNKNNGYDVGDYLAWVEKTNATPSASPFAGVLPPSDPYEEPPSGEDP